MPSGRWSWLYVVAAVSFSGCAQTPTSPSAVAPSVVVGVAPRAESPAIPPRLTATPPRALGVTRYLAFGDSITWGAMSACNASFLFAAANGGYPERLQAGLNAFHPPQQFVVFNEGLPGELALTGLSRFRSLLTSRRPEAVLLLEGVNDISNDFAPSRVATALFQMVDAATAQGIPVVVGTMYQTYSEVDPDGHYRSNGAGLVPAFNAEIRRLAQGRLNVHVLDLEPMMRDRSLVGADGIHLTDAGHEALAAAFMQRVEAAFPVRGSFQ
jgi:lysophospholipase L1-like esterase